MSIYIHNIYNFQIIWGNIVLDIEKERADMHKEIMGKLEKDEVATVEEIEASGGLNYIIKNFYLDKIDTINANEKLSKKVKAKVVKNLKDRIIELSTNKKKET